MQSFRGIRAWRKAHAFLLNCHRVLRRFPREYSSLRAQLRKAAESIPTNIVEGCGCDSSREFARFLQHSINSADETEYHLLVARDYGALRHRDWMILTEDVQEVRKMLISFRRKVIEGDGGTSKLSASS
jgi:four helix bundle protein